VGFLIERVEVTGTRLASAILDFTDGLNVVAGASDTGKSYVASLIDYAFGASSAPRTIDAAAGYTGVAVMIRDRVSGTRYRIERSFGSPRATLGELTPEGETASARSVAARHAAGTETLSSFLLDLSGFDPTWRIRTNSRGGNRTISFRDIAYLSVVHEARIIAERPPFLSENPIEHTPRTDVLRLMVTGDPVVATRELPVTTRTVDPGGQLDLLRVLIAEVESELGDSDRDSEALAARAVAATELRARALAAYEAASIELLEMESRRASAFAEIRKGEGRITIATGLQARFNLLTEHYQSDISRLTMMAEAADILVSLPIGTCPVCGADPEHHRADQVAEHFGVTDVLTAAEAEIAKIRQLEGELGAVLGGIRADRERDEEYVREHREAAVALDARLQERITPVLRSSAEDLRAADIERDEVTRVDLLLTRLASLRERAAGLEPELTDTPAAPRGTTRPLSADLEPLLRDVGTLLNAWNMPGANAVAFSDRSRDLVIAGEDRESHGKGVRALTCAAFILGLLKNASEHDRPHPGVVVLDSPLVAYREPDAIADDAGGLIAAGVKDAFYGSLARGITGGQVIILENESPNPEHAELLNYVHFSKSAAGRYGFFEGR